MIAVILAAVLHCGEIPPIPDPPPTPKALHGEIIEKICCNG
jgi:hypothetical protein